MLPTTSTHGTAPEHAESSRHDSHDSCTCTCHLDQKVPFCMFAALTTVTLIAISCLIMLAVWLKFHLVIVIVLLSDCLFFEKIMSHFDFRVM